MNEDASTRAFARRLESQAVAGGAYRVALTAGMDRLVTGWIESGGAIPWSAVPMTRAARVASRRERRRI